MEMGRLILFLNLKNDFQMFEIRLVNHRPPIISSNIIKYSILKKSTIEKRSQVFLIMNHQSYPVSAIHESMPPENIIKYHSYIVAKEHKSRSCLLQCLFQKSFCYLTIWPLT